MKHLLVISFSVFKYINQRWFYTKQFCIAYPISHFTSISCSPFKKPVLCFYLHLFSFSQCLHRIRSRQVTANRHLVAIDYIETTFSRSKYVHVVFEWAYL